MDVFSLEEDDTNGLFLTQQPKVDKVETYNFDMGGDLLEIDSVGISQSEDYATEMAFEDISDDDFQMPSSQAVRVNQDKRYL